MKVTILVGYPGSGKSTYSNNKFVGESAAIINQDTLGSRKACLKKMEELLKTNKNVIVDRTNISKKQREYFISLAQKYKAERIECIDFKSSVERCIERVHKRKNHPTITEETSLDKIKEIVLKFEHDYEKPTMDEGFDYIATWHIDNLERQTDQSS